MTDPMFSHANGPGLERTIDLDVPFPVDATFVDAHPEQHDYAAPEPPFPPDGPHPVAPDADDEAQAAIPAAGPPPDAPPAPVPLFAGTYAIYDDGHGGIVMVLQPKEGDVLTKHIPAAMIKMAEKFGGMGGAGIAGLFGKAS